MAKSDTWPGGVAMEALSNMDSAGSCDSVISVNSGYSEDSMEHLSAEERACLMYLEETIEALEVQEDSGLSNDEPDSLLQAEQMGQVRANDISSFKSDESGGDQRSDRADQPNQTSEPQSSQAAAANTKDLKTSVNLVTPVSEPVPGCEMHPPATQPDVLCLSKDEGGNLKIVSSSSLCADQPTIDSDIDPGLIPPPSDFMDEPRPPPQPLKAKDLLSSTGISNKPTGATIDLELLRQRASTKKTSVIPSVTQQPVNKTPELSPVAVGVCAQMNPPPEAVEPRSPPAVAPKPKKLPANIILKSHKPAVADGSSGHSLPTAGSDRLLMDPQRIRMEALRKLGLLKSEEAVSGPALSPKLSPKTRKSWGSPPSPVLSAAPQTPPTTPSFTHHSSPSPLESPAVVLPSTAPAVEEVPDILPAPAAFSDPDGALLSDNDPSVKDVSDHTVNALGDTPPRTPPALLQLTPPRGKSVKSATLERSGLGLSSYMASQNSHEASQGVGTNQSPSQLRNNRPRPASLGSGKEFSSAQAERSPLSRPISREPDSRRSLPAVQHPDNSQKLPRSQGISVLICPRAENGDDRREALKRLGLLRD